MATSRSGAGIDTSGFDELLSMLESMGSDAKKIQDKVLTAAAEPILDDMVSNAPELTGKGKEGLKISKPATNNGVRFVKIGINKADMSDVFYMKFHEWGTTKMQAKPFMQPALESNRRTVKEVMLEELKRGLGL